MASVGGAAGALAAQAAVQKLVKAVERGNVAELKTAANALSKQGGPGEGGTPEEAVRAVRDSMGRGMLHYAAQFGQLHMMEHLVKACKLDVNAQDSKGEERGGEEATAASDRSCEQATRVPRTVARRRDASGPGGGHGPPRGGGAAAGQAGRRPGAEAARDGHRRRAPRRRGRQARYVRERGCGCTTCPQQRARRDGCGACGRDRRACAAGQVAPKSLALLLDDPRVQVNTPSSEALAVLQQGSGASGSFAALWASDSSSSATCARGRRDRHAAVLGGGRGARGRRQAAAHQGGG